MKLASLKARFRALKTDENKLKALKITVMLFNFVFLCLLWRVVTNLKCQTGIGRESTSDKSHFRLICDLRKRCIVEPLF